MRRVALVTLALLCLLVVARWWVHTRGEVLAAPAAHAADALPVYLGVATVRRGGDPTDDAQLAAAYAAESLQVPASHFSTLYPASTAALLAPVVPSGWDAFVRGWRELLLAGAVLAGTLGGAAGAPQGRRWGGAGLGAAATTTLFPVVTEAARLGQMNVLLAGMAGAAQLAVTLDAAGLSAALLVLGGGLKLVPLGGAWPLLAGRRWRALAAGAAVGIGVLAATHAVLPLPNAVAAVLETARFESAAGARPGLAVDPTSPVWLVTLVRARHLPLGLLTLAVAGVAAWRAGARRGEALAGGIALVFAWLAADASGQHALYLPLLLSALAWAVVWPLADDAPRAAWLAPLLTVPFVGVHTLLQPAERIGLLGATCVWAVVAWRTLRAAGPLTRADRGVLLACALLAVAIGARPSASAALGGGPPQDRIVPDARPR